ncbi:hypothetical protein ACR6C2_40025 [Streptomyces sp. INA 01156]
MAGVECLRGAHRDDPKAAGRPFLQLWQSGFDGHLSGAYRFGHVAVGGCLALVMLFVLTAVHGYRRTRAERREEQAGSVPVRLWPVWSRSSRVLSSRSTSTGSPRRSVSRRSSTRRPVGCSGCTPRPSPRRRRSVEPPSW